MTSLAKLLRNRLRTQADLLTALTDHPTLVGTGREHALAELLREFVPRRLEVLTGTIAHADETGQPQIATSQVDIMIVDTLDYPVLLRLGGTVVALPQAVRATVEVKSDLKKGKKFWEAIQQLARVQICAGIDNRFVTALFSFGAPTKKETLREWLQDLLAKRNRLRGSAKRTKDPKKKQKTLDRANEFAPHLLPDFIISDQGAVAMKATQPNNPPEYQFFVTDAETPAAVAFVDQMMQRTAPRVIDTVPVASGTSGSLTQAFRLVSSFLNAPLKEDKACAVLSLG